MHCLDLLTGQADLAAQEREDGCTWPASTRAGRCSWARNQVTALQLSDGKPAWPKPLALSDPPSGRGFYSEQYYFLPTARPNC